MTTENNVAAQAGDEPMRAAPDLTPVIHWLEGGCDPYQAAKELRIYQRTIGQVEAPAIIFSPRATADVERDAARYRWLLDNYARGDGYTDIDEALNEGEPEKYLSPAIDAAILATTKPEA